MDPPVVRNPFVHKIEFSWVRKVQICLMSLTFAPLRALSLLVLFVITWIFSFLFTLGLPDELNSPLSPRRVALLSSLRWFGLLAFKIAGFSFIIKGERASSEDAPIIVAAPHSTLFDISLWFVTSPLPAALSKIENFKIPMFGTLVKAVQPVLVVRGDAQSRQTAVDRMEKRVKQAKFWPQLIIFPEGTRTNTEFLISFKPGGFLCGSPVQPMTIKYLNSWNTFIFTESGPSELEVLWLTFCQFWVEVEIEYLPVYYPNHEETSDPKIFARNVRNFMAEKIGVVTTEHSYKDRMLMKRAGNMGFPKQHICLEIDAITKKYDVTVDQINLWLNRFVAMSKHRNDGLISVEDLSMFLCLSVCDAMQQLFEMYDTSGSGSINFNQYVCGQSLVHATATAKNTLQFTCNVYHNFLSDNFQCAQNLPDIEQNNMSLLVKQIEMHRKLSKPPISVKDFFICRPEFAILCLCYQLQTETSPKDCANTINNNVTHRRNLQTKTNSN